MTDILLFELAEITKGKTIGDKNAVINEIIIDSRTFSISENLIFFALKGKNHDGHNFVGELYEKGLRNFVVSDFRKEYEKFKDANFLKVKNTLDALRDTGAYFRKKFKKPLTAIIGSNGKTIVKEWLYHLLKDDFKIIKSPKSYNSQVGVPLSLTLLDNKFDFAFIEAGISRKGEMQKLENTIKPDNVIFVNIGDAHQEGFSSVKEKAEEKLKMTKNAKLLVFSPDYEILNELVAESATKTFSWSQNIDIKADINLVKTVKQKKISEITVKIKNKEITYKIPFIDDASVKNSLVCLSFIISQNMFSEEILRRFETLEPVEMRTEQKRGINNCMLINDYYNSDLISLKNALDTLNHLSVSGKKTLILSDILQSGIKNSELYEKTAEYIKTAGIGKFIGIGKAVSENKKYFADIKETRFFRSTDDFLNSDLIRNFKNENILLKASRSFKFERISEILQQKKHRTVLEINTEALVHNLNFYKSFIKPETKITAMVKALSYGSGTYEIAKILQHNKVDALGVALTDEGVILRKSGVYIDITVMNPDEDGFDDIINYKLEPEIYGFNILNAFAEKVEKYPDKKIPVHIKIDTGMKRLGFCDFEIDRLIQKLNITPRLYVKSIFSHLAVADEPDKDKFTLNQISKFKKISDKIIKELGYDIERHILNSAGTERFPEYQFERIRLGIGLYGFGHNQSKLMNVSTLKTRILQTKKVKKGETVGYGRAFRAEKDMRIAVLPIGYADGFSRALSNGIGEVLIDGQKCPIVGNVCMDMCMADISDIYAEEGDEVIVFGNDYPASKIAEKLNTIPYEIITGISERVKRIYIG